MYFARAVAAILCFTGSVCSFAQADEKAIVLGSFPVSAAPHPAFELVVAECQADQCPIEIRLQGRSEPAPGLRLDWSAPSKTIEPGEQNVTGVGALLSPEKIRSWTIGGNEKGIAVAAKPLLVAKKVPALLVTQTAGFEHVKRRHYLIVANAGRLQLAWRGVERQGPHFLGASVVNGPNGAEVIVTDVFANPDTARPDTVNVRKLQWTKGAAREIRLRAPIPATVLGPFASAADARAARTGATCLAGYLVLPAGRVGQPRGFVLAAPASTAGAARQALKDVQSCAPSVQGRAAFLRPPA